MKPKQEQKFCDSCNTWRDYRGLERHRQACIKIQAQPKGWIEQEYAAGHSTTSIGSRVGVAQQTIANYLVEQGVTLRGKGHKRGGYASRSKKHTLADRKLARDPRVKGGCAGCKWYFGCDPNAEEPLPCEAPLIRAQLDGDDFSELEFWIMRGWVKVPRNGSVVT